MVERARPLLGTYVAIRVAGLPAARAQHAMDAAFAEIALVHARMSFHIADSDVGRLNREALDRPVAIHPHTGAVLRWARAIAEQSAGSFDVTVAPRLVDWGLLPAPEGAPRPDPQGSWRDIVIGDDGRVRFARPLWIDLGGIAKGYAVDCAVERLRAFGAAQGSVNAGGDLRVFGPAAERVGLRPEPLPAGGPPVMELRDGSLASSNSRLDARRGPHVDGRRRRATVAGRFVCVVAERCVIADALTKAVLVRGRASDPLLRRFGAVAHVHGPRGWRRLGAAA